MTAHQSGLRSAPLAAGAARPGLRRQVRGRSLRRWLLDLVLLGIGIACVGYEPVSIAIHSVIGLIFAGAVGPHLWERRAWIRGTWRRLRERRRLGAANRLAFWQGVLLAVLVVVVTVSGLWDWLAGQTKIRYHAISGFLLIGVLAWHTWTRRRMLFARIARRRPRDSARPDG